MNLFGATINQAPECFEEQAMIRAFSDSETNDLIHFNNQSLLRIRVFDKHVQDDKNLI